jgi:hypothetical protein
MRLRRLNVYQVICALLIAAMCTGCTRASQLGDEAPEVQMAMTLNPDPPWFGRPCYMVVTLLDADGTPIEDAQLEIKGDMTHAGMIPVVAAITGGADGRYATAFEWTMAGDWIVTVEAALSDGRIARRQFELTVEVPGG